VCGREIVETEVGQQPDSKVLQCDECGEQRTFRRQKGR
jgi:hypothetical protein